MKEKINNLKLKLLYKKILNFDLIKIKKINKNLFTNIL